MSGDIITPSNGTNNVPMFEDTRYRPYSRTHRYGVSGNKVPMKDNVKKVMYDHHVNAVNNGALQVPMFGDTRHRPYSRTHRWDTRGVKVPHCDCPCRRQIVEDFSVSPIALALSSGFAQDTPPVVGDPTAIPATGPGPMTTGPRTMADYSIDTFLALSFVGFLLYLVQRLGLKI